MNHVRLVLQSIALLIGLVLPLSASARFGDVFLQSLFELIAGGPVDEQQREFTGARHERKPTERDSIIGRRVQEDVGGVDPLKGPDQGRAVGNYLQRLNVPQEDREHYQLISGPLAGFWPVVSTQSNSQAPPAPTSQPDEFTWESARELAAKSPTFFTPVLVRGAALAHARALQGALDRAVPPGGVLPLNEGQTEFGGPRAGETSDQAQARQQGLATSTRDNIVAPAEQTNFWLRQLLGAQQTVAVTQQDPHALAASDPNDPLPAVTLAEPGEQGKVVSVAVRKGDAAPSAEALAAAGQSAGQSADILAQVGRAGGILDRLLAQSYTNISNQISNALANNPHDLANQFFGARAPDLQNIFGADYANHLLDRFGNGFRGGDRGGGGRAPDPVPNRERRPAPTGVCADYQPNLDEDMVYLTAYLLGLPNPSERWVAQIHAVVDPANPNEQIAGTYRDPLTGTEVTVAPEEFGGESCAWLVISPQPTRTDLAILSDHTRPAGVRRLVSIAGS